MRGEQGPDAGHFFRIAKCPILGNTANGGESSDDPVFQACEENPQCVVLLLMAGVVLIGLFVFAMIP